MNKAAFSLKAELGKPSEFLDAKLANLSAEEASVLKSKLQAWVESPIFELFKGAIHAQREMQWELMMGRPTEELGEMRAYWKGIQAAFATMEMTAERIKKLDLT